MKTGTTSDKPRVLFLVPVGGTFSGQTDAALMLRRMLEDDGYGTSLVEIPVLDRGEESGRFPHIRYLWRYFKALLRTPLLAASSPYVYITPGQTKVSFLRDYPLFFIATLISHRWSAAAIHGSLFMEWDEVRGLRRLFLSLLRRADSVTILGMGHYRKLVSLGIPAEKLHIVPNPTDMAPLDEARIADKHANVSVVRILYLSLLLDSKGYPEYLEALKRLSMEKLPRRIEAVLCGPLIGSVLSDRFDSLARARSWIEAIVAEINRSANVSVRWVEGAKGEAKAALMREAHLFVLPSRYRNEAQPLSIIEAMASGAAVISTTVGEIPGSFGDCALLLNSVEAGPLSAALRSLALDDAARREP